MIALRAVEGKRAGDSDSDRDSKDDSKDSTASGSNINSKQVKAVLLAGDSQCMHQSQRT